MSTPVPRHENKGNEVVMQRMSGKGLPIEGNTECIENLRNDPHLVCKQGRGVTLLNENKLFKL